MKYEDAQIGQRVGKPLTHTYQMGAIVGLKDADIHQVNDESVLVQFDNNPVPIWQPAVRLKLFPQNNEKEV